MCICFFQSRRMSSRCQLFSVNERIMSLEMMHKHVTFSCTLIMRLGAAWGKASVAPRLRRDVSGGICRVVAVLNSSTCACRTLKQAETLEDLMTAMRELRDALSIPGSPFGNYGGSWDQLLQRCCSGGASLAETGQLMAELKVNAKAWIQVREQEVLPVDQEQKVCFTLCRTVRKTAENGHVFCHLLRRVARRSTSLWRI